MGPSERQATPCFVGSEEWQPGSQGPPGNGVEDPPGSLRALWKQRSLEINADAQMGKGSVER